MDKDSIFQELFRYTERPMSLGLERTAQLLELLGNPHRSLRTVHIAGTNGKGSVATMMARALGSSGLKTGLYTSPHISSFRERISINGSWVSIDQAKRLLDKVLSPATEVEPTFFEVLTAMAFEHFAEESVDVAVIETGLGGRLDATNVIKPGLSVITSIDLDHCAQLGSTRLLIAKEKAGIIKQGVPVVLGPQAQGLGIEQIAQDRQAPLAIVEGDFEDYRAENRAIARVALEELQIARNAIEAGISLPVECRFERVPLPHPVILDVAHNPNGFDRMLRAAREAFPGAAIDCVVALSKRKDPRACLQALQSVDRLHLASTAHARIAPLEIGLEARKELNLPIGLNGPLDQVLSSLLASPPELLIICGSHFVMADAKRLLGIGEQSSDLLHHVEGNREDAILKSYRAL